MSVVRSLPVALLVVAFIGIGSMAAAQTAGLVSHWQMDEGAGTSVADVAGGRNGTLTNGAGWTAGRIGPGVSLDGTNDYIAVPTFDVAGSALTIALWVKSSSGGEQWFVAKTNGPAEPNHYWMVSRYTSNGAARLRFRLKAGGKTTTLVAASGTLPLNTWYHVAATYDGTAMRLYLDGVQVGSVAKSGSLATSKSVPVNIGRNSNGSSYVHGVIDDVRIYNRALTAIDIGAVSGLSGGTANQPPAVSLLTPTSGAVYAAPASIEISASASDSDGAVSGLDFYAGSSLIGADSTSPYAITWDNVPAGSYSLTAVARDNAGASTVSSTRDVVVRDPDLPSEAVFTPSSDHSTAVDRYILSIYAAGADPTVSNAISTEDLGKPDPIAGECRADVSQTIAALAPGMYVATVTAMGAGGSAQSQASPAFSR